MMETKDDFLKKAAESYGVFLNEEMCKKFEVYLKLLIEWNEKVNLTAITDPNEIKIKHFVDSLLLLSSIDIKKGQTLIDIGTGAGFPGVPIKIARPDINLTLLDSLNKRLLFLNELTIQIGLKTKIIHARAEEGAGDEKLRESFSIATSRAVAPLPILLEYCLPYVKVNGFFVAMKGPGVYDEIKLSKNALNVLGGEIKEIKEVTLPDKSERSIVIIKKIKNIPSKYPRRGVKISKNPL